MNSFVGLVRSHLFIQQVLIKFQHGYRMGKFSIKKNLELHWGFRNTPGLSLSGITIYFRTVQKESETAFYL